MTSEIPFAENDHIELLDDWTVTFSNHYTKGRMWNALGCNNDPVYMAAWERWGIAVAKIQALHNRGLIVNKPSEIWDAANKQWLVSPISREPQGEDARRIAALQMELSGEEELRTFAKATLPKNTVLQVVRMTIFDDFETAVIKLDIVETSHAGLQLKKQGGHLSNGKRNILLKGHSFASAEFTILKPN